MPLPAWVPRTPTPLWSAYQHDLADTRTHFAIPGHKRREHLSDPSSAYDRPLELSGDLTRPSIATLQAAETLAAQAWGVPFARFSVNGSSACNQAALTAVSRPGDTVIVSRAAHKSVLQGFIYSGATPVWLSPRLDPATGLPGPLSVDQVAEALRSHPQTTAVMVGSPNYVGGVEDVAALAAVAHSHGAALIVDAAWGAHFGWHPDLPTHPLALGADVMITSTHKTLPAHTQTALLMARGDYVDLERLNRTFDGTQTTSPAASLVASIDFARALLQERGEELIGSALLATQHARGTLRSIPGLEVLTGRGFDPLKLVILTAGAGIDGRLVQADLRAEGVDLETANRDMLIPQVTMVDDADTVSDLLGPLMRSLLAHAGEPRQAQPVRLWNVEADVVMTPQEASYSDVEIVAWSECEGRICAETVAPYPPGVPVLAPGERVTRPAREALRAAQEAGVPIAFAADASLATLRVLR